MQKLAARQVWAMCNVVGSICKDLESHLNVKGLPKEISKEIQISYQHSSALVAHLSRLESLLKKN